MILCVDQIWLQYESLQTFTILKELQTWCSIYSLPGHLNHADSNKNCWITDQFRVPEGQNPQHLEPLNKSESRTPTWTLALTTRRQWGWSYYSRVIITATTVSISSVQWGNPSQRSTGAEPPLLPPPPPYLGYSSKSEFLVTEELSHRKKQREALPKAGSCICQHVPSASPAPWRPHQHVSHLLVSSDSVCFSESSWRLSASGTGSAGGGGWQMD